ncbi:MAG: VWA domain-containing protein, partial [Saprospiraceae bacterium]|nr:VWA domain-containing protein [Saprospiraceae bacterium]
WNQRQHLLHRVVGFIGLTFLICDVSRSMELYSRFLIHFMFGLQQAFSRMETFVFGTRLTRITAAMQAENFDKALQQLQEQVPDWFGGTRIGASLEQFCTEFSHQLLNKKTIVLIMSDGWDTGGIDTLEKSMQTLHKKSAKVIWLNPLAGNLNYQPSVRAMEVALPYVDVHLAAHNIDSLKALLKHL